MKPIDLTGLIKGLMVVIGIALAVGKLDALQKWATKEAFPNFRGKQTLTRENVNARKISSDQK